MDSLRERLGRDMLIIEGAMGTMLQRAHMVGDGTAPEMANIIEPDFVAQIHRYYAYAGADCAVSNTFGASLPKLTEYGLAERFEEINRKGMRLARKGGAPHVLADIGPSGLVMTPIGTATFERVYEVFADQIAILADEDADAFLLETFTDIAELRVAVLACKEIAPAIPVLATVAVNTEGRMELSGTDPVSAAIILEAAGADAVGMNCGIGPEQMLPLIEEVAAATTLPVIAQPNAGLPHINSFGETLYPGTAQQMGAFTIEAHRAGVSLIGSCCGSTPEFTGAIADELFDKQPADVEGRGFAVPVVAGPRGHVVIGQGPLKLIGERINPTGKDLLTDELLAGTFETALHLAVEQERDGADLLDVNVGAAGIDEVAVLADLVHALSGLSNLPLVIDTSDAEALEAALRIYPGRALINSVNADPASYEPVFTVAQKYGACLIALALDQNGIPARSQERLAVIESLRHAAHEAGIADNRLVIDGLVMTEAVDPDAPRVTLETMVGAKALGLTTVLGISNVSYGMDERSAVNARFFDAAKDAGLDAAIVNVAEINAARDDAPAKKTVSFDIADLSMTQLAEKFKAGEIFLPQLMGALDDIKKKSASRHWDGGEARPTIVFATVAGDIHSIGKDICVALLESQGFKVIDLGVDVPVKKVVSVARAEKPLAVCLSALMTTTLPAMESTVATLNKYLPKMPVCVGGAIVTQAWADSIKAHYSADAPSCVTLIESLEAAQQ